MLPVEHVPLLYRARSAQVCHTDGGVYLYSKADFHGRQHLEIAKLSVSMRQMPGVEST